MLEGYNLDGVEERIRNNSTVDESSQCWVWNKRLDKYGYGKISVKRLEKKDHGNTTHDSVIASRASFAVFKGAIPTGMLVCHTCDNRACVNPDHLYAGTPQKNMNDMVERGRAPKTKSEKFKQSLSKTATGRTRLYKPDGTWTWQYPQ